MLLSNRLKPAAWVSIGLFVLMLIGSIVYYRDRMLFADASHIAFSAINEQQLQIQQFRFGAAITQVVPIVGAKLGLSVRSIMLAYSLSFNLFYLFVACVMMFWFRAYRLLVLYALYWALVTTHSFFWPNNEVHQGIAYMFLMFPALLASGKRNYTFLLPVLIVLLLGGTAIFCHPLVLAPFLFLWFYHILEKRHWPFDEIQTIVLSLSVSIVVVLKLFVSMKYSGYDSALLQNVVNFRCKDLSNIFSSPFAREVFRHITLNYWQLPFLIIAGIIVLFLERKYILTFWTLACIFVYFICLCLTFKGYLEFFSESELMPCVIISCAPFVFRTLMSIDKPWLIAALLAIIFILRFSTFYEARWHFVSRKDRVSDLLVKMKKKGINKLVLVKKEGLVDWTWMADWGFAAETMMLSASIWDQPIRQIIVMTENAAKTRLPVKNNEVLVCFETWPAGKLNYKYFPFDTTRPYTVMKYDEFVNGP